MRHVTRQSLQDSCPVAAIQLVRNEIPEGNGLEFEQESERTISGLLADVPAILYRCSVQAPWRLTYVSAGVELLTGYTTHEVTHPDFTWAGIVHPEDVGQIDREVAERIQLGGVFSLHYRIIDRHGDVRWVSEHGRPIYGPNGSPLYLEGIITDVTEHKSAEAKAKANSDRFQSTLDCVPQMLWSVAADGTSDYYRNKQWSDYTGIYGPGSNLLEWQSVIHPDDWDRVVSIWSRCVATGSPYRAEYRIRHHTGDFRWICSEGVVVEGRKGEPARWYGTCTDIHDRVVAEDAAAESVALTQGIVQASPDCLSVLSVDGKVLLVNRATVEAYGVEESQLIGHRWGARLSKEYGPLVSKLMNRARNGKIGRATVHITGASGITRWWDMVVTPLADAHGEVTKIAVTSRDVTEQKIAQEEVVWAAMHDQLTGLPNRSFLEKAINESIKACRSIGCTFGLLLLDVDHFKLINDALGHEAGDKFLRSFANRLLGAVDPKDFVARLAGDEFAVLIRSLGDERTLEESIEQILAAVMQPFEYEGRLLDTGASIGVSRYPAEGTSRKTLLKNADLALYTAKRAGRGTWALFAPNMRSEVKRRSSMLSLAKEVLKKSWVVPFYQPKIDLVSGELAGVEALLRWRHPRKGIQNCSTIQAGFEDLNVAQRITDAMLDRVVADIQRWQDEGYGFGHVAINAAAGDFRRADFAEAILERLVRASIPACRLQVEVTESVFLGRGAECVERALSKLNAAGIQIALDDFGTGYASLAHLKKFPVSILKIDQSFVRSIENGPEDAAIIQAVVNLGKSLGMTVIAEGIETMAQHGAVLELGCGYGQGFLYGRAKPAHSIERLFMSRTRGKVT